jgi:hypothetical protein
MSNTLPPENIFYKGDTIIMQFQLFRNKSTSEYWNLTSNEIRFEIKEGEVSIKKANTAAGGDDDQIKIDNAVEGLFTVTVEKEETEDLAVGDYHFEVEVTNATGDRTTVLTSLLRIVDEIIDWETP